MTRITNEYVQEEEKSKEMSHYVQAEDGAPDTHPSLILSTLILDVTGQ